MAYSAVAKKKKSGGTDYAAAMKAAQKKGDKKAFYTAQRKRAEKTGDSKTLSSIQGKRSDAFHRQLSSAAGSSKGATGMRQQAKYVAAKPTRNVRAEAATKSGRAAASPGGLGGAIGSAMKRMGGGSGPLGMQTTAETSAAYKKQNGGKKKVAASNGSKKKSS